MKLSSAAVALAILAFASAAPTAEPSFNETLEARGTDAPYGIKKGLAYNNGGITGVLSRAGSATWAYNWGAAPNAPKFQQIPMHWGPGGKGDKNGIHSKIDKGDTPWVLGYNEPDMDQNHGGCWATPRQAYDDWGNDMFQFQERGAKLVCPGISSYNTDKSQFTGYASGLTWLRQFASIGNNPNQFRCSAQAIHWYGEAGKNGRDQAQLFINYVAYAHGVVNDIFKKEVSTLNVWVRVACEILMLCRWICGSLSSLLSPCTTSTSWPTSWMLLSRGSTSRGMCRGTALSWLRTWSRTTISTVPVRSLSTRRGKCSLCATARMCFFWILRYCDVISIVYVGFLGYRLGFSFGLFASCTNIFGGWMVSGLFVVSLTSPRRQLKISSHVFA